MKSLRALQQRLKIGLGNAPRGEEGVPATLALDRALLLFAGAVYLTWWFAVRLFLPHAYNPLGSRLLVVCVFGSFFTWTYLSRWAAAHARLLFNIAVWGLTLHYFHLVLGNHGHMDWVVGSYFCVVGVNACLQDRRSMLAYNAFVLVLVVGVELILPVLQPSLLLPGVVTIGLASYVGLHHRLALLSKLGRSTQRFHSLFDAAFEGILLHDGVTILDANASAAALLHWQAEELVGTSLAAHWGQATPLSLLAPETWPVERRFDLVGVRKDGTYVTLEAWAKPHVDAGRMVGLLAIRDVSDRKRAEEERIRSVEAEAGKAAAERELRQREEFISITAHELRTPLTTLQLQLQQLMRRSDQASWGPEELGRARSQMTACGRQVQRLSRLTQDLLELSWLDQHRLHVESEWLNLAQVAEEVVANFAPESAKAECEVTLSSEGDLSLRGDRFRLEQVLSNLLRNAVLYGKGAPISVRLFRQGDMLVATVQDHGIGIELAHQVRIFERFERAVSSRHYGGMGLGLYIADQIVRAHQGSLTVLSEPGKGASFTVRLPRQPLALQ